MLKGRTGPGAEPEVGRQAAEPAVGSETKPPPGGWAAGAKVLPLLQPGAGCRRQGQCSGPGPPGPSPGEP